MCGVGVCGVGCGGCRVEGGVGHTLGATFDDASGGGEVGGRHRAGNTYSGIAPRVRIAHVPWSREYDAAQYFLRSRECDAAQYIY